MNNKDILINKFHIPRWTELPNVDLYLDQVVNFINSTLSPYLFLNNDKKKENIQTIIYVINIFDNFIVLGIYLCRS